MAEPLWTSQEIVAATGGRLEGEAFTVEGVSIDSRTVAPGDLFVAMAGVRDGNDFIEGALARGAAGALATRSGPGSRIIVDDTLRALERLGIAARDRAPARRAAITGSVGKTSVTQAVKAGLALAGRSHGSVESYNNHIGVPLTLARMPRDTQLAVFEIGMNHAGEIEPLVKMVQPDAVAITTVGAVHTENFPEGEHGVALAKAEIFRGLKSGGVAVLNSNNKWFGLLKGEAEAAGAQVRTFGVAGHDDAQLLNFTADAGGARVVARLDGQAIEFAIRHTGQHWGLNSLAVILTLLALGVDFGTAEAALAGFESLDGRGAERIVEGPRGAFTLIDESYNANPISMTAALDTLARRAADGRKLAVMTDMLELGPDEIALHAGLAPAIEAAGIDRLYCAGPLMKSLYDALPPAVQGGYAPTAAELAPLVTQSVGPGDVVMVKGSKGSKAHAIAAALVALGQGGPG